MMTKPFELIIINNNPKECAAFEECVKRYPDLHLLAMTASTDKGLYLTQSLLPGAVILDLTLGEDKCLAYVRSLKLLNLASKPYLVATALQTSRPATLQILRNYGVEFIFFRHIVQYGPEQVVCLINRMGQYFATSHDTGKPPKDAGSTQAKERQRLSNELERIGIVPKLLGHAYILCSVFYIINKVNAPSDLYTINIVDDVYQYVADEFHTKKGKVERNIRYALELAWGDCEADILKEYFLTLMEKNNGRPRNKDFIIYCANKIKPLL